MLCWRHLQPPPAPPATASSQLLQTFQSCPSHLFESDSFWLDWELWHCPAGRRGKSLRREGVQGLKLQGDGAEGLQTEVMELRGYSLRGDGVKGVETVR